MNNFSILIDKHKDKTCLILGNGPSITLLDNITLNKNIVTIGVNRIIKKYTPDYLVIIDPTTRFSKKDQLEIYSSGVPNLITARRDEWTTPSITNQYEIRLGQYIKFNNLFKNNNIIDYGLDSPYMAIMMAYKMGFTIIGLLGVDYYGTHFYDNKKHPHENNNKLKTVKYAYTELYNQLKSKVKIYNLSEKSIIKDIPYMNINEFNVLY